MLLAGAVLITGNLTWFTVEIDGAGLEVTGQSAAPALSGLALAVIAAAGALALAPVVLRFILGAVQALLGVVAVAVIVPVVADPALAVSPRVTEATGIDGDDSVRAVIDAVASSPAPVFALIAAGLAALVGVAVVATARRWPVPGRRYASADTTASPVAEDDTRRRAEDEWDALSRGDDPTT